MTYLANNKHLQEVGKLGVCQLRDWEEGRTYNEPWQRVYTTRSIGVLRSTIGFSQRIQKRIWLLSLRHIGVSNVQMPVLDGYETMKSLRENRDVRRILVIVDLGRG